jgi:membrane-bound ClpP family serine protease
MWLPKAVYEALPYFYAGLGAVLLGAAFYARSLYLPEVLAGSGLVALIAGLVLILRRRGYRASRSRLELDESP